MSTPKLDDIRKALAAETGTSIAEAARVLDHLAEAVHKEIGANRCVILPGLGRLHVQPRVARSGTAPNGTKWTTPAHNVVVFHPVKELRDSV